MKTIKSIHFNKLNYFILFVICLIPLIWSKYLNANYVSAKFTLVYFISSFSLFVSTQKIVLPKLPTFVSWSFILIFVFQLLSPLISNNWAHFYYEFKFFSFLFFAYYFYTLNFNLEDLLKKNDFVLLIVSALIIIFALNDFYNYRIDRLDIQSGFLLGSFGNVNMLAEFLVFTLPLIHWWARKPSTVLPSIKYFILFGWLFFIFYCRSRSAWIGCSLWLIFGLLTKKINWKDLALVVLAFGCFQLAVLTPAVKGEVTLVDKQGSFSQRLHLYVKTLELIKDHPIGVGIGQFQNEIMPYMVNSEFKPLEYVYFDQPHSEFLKWAVQFGWLGLALSLAVLGFILFVMIKSKNIFLLSSFFVVLPQFAFQFPFENPASLLYLAFLFAMTMKLLPIEKVIELNLIKRIPFLLLAVIGIWNSFAFVSSVYMETSHQNKLENIMYACEVYPTNVNACFNRNNFLIVTNNQVMARMTLTQDLGKFPFHAGLLRLLPIYLKNIGQERKACEAILMYDFIFEKQNFFKPDTVQSCQILKKPVQYEYPEQFKNDYLKWQRQALQ